RSPKQTSRIFRRAWNDDCQSRIMRERGFVRLTVPQTSAGQISAVWRVDHGRAFPVSERAPPQIRDVRNQLIESRIDEIDELQLEDRPAAVSGEAARDAEDGRFSERR